MDSGESNWTHPSQSQGQTRRRLAAGEAERGDASGFVHSGNQMGGGEHLRVAGDEPQLLVVVVELGVAGNGASDELGGRRSLGDDEPEATEHGEARGEVLWVPTSAVSALDMVVWPVGGRSHVGDELHGDACG